MRTYIFRCWLSLGDIVLLTAAIRDLQLHFPGRYRVDVRTCFPDLWLHNPHLVPLDEYGAGVKVADCVIPLVNESHHAGCHCIHSFIDYLNRYLGTSMKPTAFRGDIHLSPHERSQPSPLRALTGEDIPFWLVSAGGKHDCTIKWWQSQRYQEVVDHFRGRIQFVQVGNLADHHPKLRGAIDLRGRTSIRDLICLVHHAQGVLCGVTGLMHLAAAVPVRDGCPENRPCVVVAGGREPPHWEAYPGHQFIHTVGSLACCARGGCWKARALPLGDGLEYDQPEHLCLDVKGSLPRCMDMISSEEVIRRIMTYFDGGVCHFLRRRKESRSSRSAARMVGQPEPAKPLTFYSAPELAEEFLGSIPPAPGNFDGRGIVICAGGVATFTNAWVSINMLRRLGCALPIQLWHCGEAELDDRMRSLVAPLGVECVDAERGNGNEPVRFPHVWAVKPYALLHCRFREVLLLDADNVPVTNPEYLFEAPEYRRTGAAFWPDYWQLKRDSPSWALFGVPYRRGYEFETGQVLVDKAVCWRALHLCLWYNQHCELFYRYVHGDKQTFQMAFLKLKAPYSMPRRSIHRLRGVMCQHDFKGRRVFQHRNSAKWSLFASNPRISGFKFERECRRYLAQLARVWDGEIEKLRPPAETSRSGESGSIAGGCALSIFPCMVTCPERESIRRQTLSNLASTDWGPRPVHVHVDEKRFGRHEDRVAHAAWRALHLGLQADADYILYLEDDLKFNVHFLQNLNSWTLLQNRQLAIASLFNPGFRELSRAAGGQGIVIDPRALMPSQALLISRQAAQFLVDNWRNAPVPLPVKLAALSSRFGRQAYCHSPSLVRHMGLRSIVGRPFLRATDFRPHWAAPGSAAVPLRIRTISQEATP